MHNPGDIVEIVATNEMIKRIGAELQLKQGMKVKVVKTFPDSWVVVEGELLGVPCNADVPKNFLKKMKHF